MTLSVAADRILTAPSCIKCSNDSRSFATPKALKIHLGIKERKQRASKCCAEEKSRAAQARDTNVHAGFPPGFYFGAASSAYQVEGATKEGGRGPSIWDTFCEKYPEKIVDRSSGEPGSGSYYQYKKDVELLRELGANAYRFSISWARVLPTGHGEPNEEGIRYYKNLIDELKNNGIEPFVTIFHWDMPQALEDKYEGFLSENIVEDYKHFANVCFENFGGKVKHWITLNEPSNFSVFGYSTGIAAPGRCTPGLTSGENTYTCPAGDSLSEPYIVGHNLLLAHAEVVGLYRDKYQKQQGGKIGITLTTNWYEPYNDDTLDKEAQQRALEFNLGWFLDPLKYGNYPFSMRSLVGKRLPKFTEKESQKLKNSYDFIGINYYTSLYARNIAFEIDYQPKICTDDMRVETPDNKGGLPIGYAEGEDNWVKVYPRGLTDLLQYVKERYTNPEVYITENGVMEMREKLQKISPPTPLIPNKELQDIYRSEYHSSHLHQLAESARKGVKVKGYFAWSLLDSFEWVFGYRSRFGLAYVNNDFPGSAGLSHDLVRVPKHSYHWYKWFLQIAKDPHHII